MKNFKLFLMIVVLIATFTSCERVAPNYQGVLMENFGKNGKSDFSLQKGIRPTARPTMPDKSTRKISINYGRWDS